MFYFKPYILEYFADVILSMLSRCYAYAKCRNSC